MVLQLKLVSFLETGVVVDAGRTGSFNHDVEIVARVGTNEEKT